MSARDFVEQLCKNFIGKIEQFGERLEQVDNPNIADIKRIAQDIFRLEIAFDTLMVVCWSVRMKTGGSDGDEIEHLINSFDTKIELELSRIKGMLVKMLVDCVVTEQ